MVLLAFKSQCLFCILAAQSVVQELAAAPSTLLEMQHFSPLLSATDGESAFLAGSSNDSHANENVSSSGLHSIKGKTKALHKHLSVTVPLLPQGHPSPSLLSQGNHWSHTAMGAHNLTLGSAHSGSKEKFPEQITLHFALFTPDVYC